MVLNMEWFVINSPDLGECCDQDQIFISSEHQASSLRPKQTKADNRIRGRGSVLASLQCRGLREEPSWTADWADRAERAGRSPRPLRERPICLLAMLLYVVKIKLVLCCAWAPDSVHMLL